MWLSNLILVQILDYCDKPVCLPPVTVWNACCALVSINPVNPGGEG